MATGRIPESRSGSNRQRAATVGVWPDGFTLLFDPQPVLRDERGLVAREGEIVRLTQVDPSSAGTFEDPYVASGLLFDGCYPFRA